jgi:hypothetical protein
MGTIIRKHLPYLPATTSWNYNYGNQIAMYAQNISGATIVQW